MDEYTDSMEALGKMDDDELAQYFEQLAEDHRDSGTYMTAADYQEAANRLRNRV